MATSPFENPNKKIVTFSWTGTKYSGDGIAGYGYADFSISANIPSDKKDDWRILAVRDIVTSNGAFIGCCRYIDSATATIQIRLFNCTSAIAYPGTITCGLVFANDSNVYFP